ADEGELLLPLPAERRGHAIEGLPDLLNLSRSGFGRARRLVAGRERLDGTDDGHDRLERAMPEPAEREADAGQQHDHGGDANRSGRATPGRGAGKRVLGQSIFARDDTAKRSGGGPERRLPTL